MSLYFSSVLAFFFALPSSCSVIFPFDGLACLVWLRVAGVVDRWARDWPSRDVEMEVVGEKEYAGRRAPIRTSSGLSGNADGEGDTDA